MECRRETALRDALSRPLSPDAQDASRLFDSAATQWQVGMGGPVGMLYGGVESAARALRLGWSEVFPFLQVLESEQLDAWAEDRKREEKKVKKRG